MRGYITKLFAQKLINAVHMALNHDDQHHDYALVDRHTVFGNQCNLLQVMGPVNPRAVDPMVAAPMPHWAQGKVIF